MGGNLELPSEEDTPEEWWIRERRKVTGNNKRGFDTLVCLGYWYLWKNRNAWTFGNISK